MTRTRTLAACADSVAAEELARVTLRAVEPDERLHAIVFAGRRLTADEQAYLDAVEARAVNGGCDE